jgi:hypothetical protein
MKLQYKVTLGCRSRWQCGQGVGLQPLNGWNRGFESRSKYESSSPMFVVCRVGSGLCDGLITQFDMIYLLTAIGLLPGGSSTVHIYTQTIHRTIQNNQYIEQHLNWRVQAVPRLGNLYPGICLTTEERARKTLSG